MLAYQHAYHAGNFADVLALTLFAVLQYLLRKSSAITYVDTHAERGLYPRSRGNPAPGSIVRARLPYGRHARRSPTIRCSRRGANGSAMSSPGIDAQPFPGSPWWLANDCREQDRLALFELHPGEATHLEAQVLPPQARRQHADGLAGIRALLPPATPRFCALIDPSYERKQEYTDVAATLQAVAAKVRHAIVMIWYPLLPSGRHHDLLTAARRSGLRKLWRSELTLHPPGEATHGMYGSGMLLLNPPWGIDTQLNASLARVASCLSDTASHASQWWVPE